MCRRQLGCLALLLLIVGQASAYTVRVLLGEFVSDGSSITASRSIPLQPQGANWSISVPQQASKTLHTYEGDTCCLVIQDNQLYINGRLVKVPALYLRSSDACWVYEGYTYPGDVLLVYQGDHWFLINHVDLETYVWGVIRWESWPGWPLEINKVCAILARTYAVNRIMHEQERVRAGKISWYDVRATNAHQTYKGAHEHQHIRPAVDETEHIILTYESKPIIAMYDACCGGVVPADISGFNFKQAPYLARPYACNYCRSAKSFDWRITYDKKLFVALMRTCIPTLGDITALSDAVYDKGGKLLSVVLHDKAVAHTVTGAQLYKACKDIKSFCYGLTITRGKIHIRGTGLGHHIGLCQWGARAMVAKGYTARQIMDYYYPGTVLMRLTSKDGHALI